MINPRQARNVAKATGPLTKTDAFEPRASAHLAEVVRPALRPLPEVILTVGPVPSRTLLVGLPEFGSLSRQQIAALFCGYARQVHAQATSHSERAAQVSYL